MFHVYVCTHVYSFTNLYLCYIYIFISKNNVYICIYIYISNLSHSRTPPGEKLDHLGDQLNLLRIDFGETASGRFQVWNPMEKKTELLGGSSHLGR